MKVLIIGGSGVLSGAVTAQILKEGIEVTLINRGHRKMPSNITLIKADHKNYEYIRSKIKGTYYDAVMDYLCYSDKDIEDSFNLYKDFTKQYFFISSCSVYNMTLPITFTEESPKETKTWSYSINKWHSELKLIELAKNSECKYTIIRPCVTYDDTRIPYGIMPPYGYHWTLCARILSHKPIITWNGGKNFCNMTHVEDFAIGLVGLIGNKKAYNEAFNLCGEETPTFADVIEILSSILGEQAITIDISPEFYAKEFPSRAGEILGARSNNRSNSNQKLKQVVPTFRQNIDIRTGIQRTIEAYIKQDYQRGIDWNFDANTDRIIAKWCKKEGIKIAGMNLHFINYLGTATIENRINYWNERYKECLTIRFLHIIIDILRKIINKIK